MLLNAAVIGLLMHEMPTVKASCQFLVGFIFFVFCRQIVVFFVSYWNVAPFINVSRKICCHFFGDLCVCYCVNIESFTLNYAAYIADHMYTHQHFLIFFI